LQFIHTSDTHLGCAQFDYSEREDDVYEAFSEVIDTAVKDEVDAVIHAGDIFHVPKPGGTPLVKLADGIKTLGDKGIKFYFTLGEHDISRITGTPSPYIFHRLGLATYVGSGKPVMHGKTMIMGFPKARRGEIDELVANLKQADEIAERHAGKKILVLHQGLVEFNKWAGELTANDLPQHFDYYAMGHLHDSSARRFERLGGPVCYPGSIDPTPGEGIKEFRKGFYHVDISGSEAKYDWVEVKSSRKQFSYEVSYEEIREKVGEVIGEIRDLPKKPILLFRVKGEDIDNSKVTSALSKLLTHCLHYAWEAVEEGKTGEILLSERPSDVRQEMLDLATKTLGTEALATFAVKELLPLLEAGSTEEALDLVNSAFERLRFKGATS
jgi:DNA repair protein SbcD/Mre11